MKTRNLKIKTLILISAIAVSGYSYASPGFEKADGKKVVKISFKEPLIKFVSSSLNLSSNDIEAIKEQINEANIFLASNQMDDFELNFESSAGENSLFVIQYTEDTPALEDWMFEEEYYNYEPQPVIEDWMMDADYLNSEPLPVLESWMFEDDYYTYEAEPVIEDWMMEEDYLYTEDVPVIEDWMMDNDYYSSSESSAGIEGWMLDKAYLNNYPSTGTCFDKKR